jgi:hypothetical protein
VHATQQEGEEKEGATWAVGTGVEAAPGREKRAARRLERKRRVGASREQHSGAAQRCGAAEALQRRHIESHHASPGAGTRYNYHRHLRSVGSSETLTPRLRDSERDSDFDFAVLYSDHRTIDPLNLRSLTPTPTPLFDPRSSIRCNGSQPVSDSAHHTRPQQH